MITNVLCVLCMLIMLANMIVIKFAVKHGIEWLQAHRNSSLSKWVDSKIGEDGSSSAVTPVLPQTIFSLRDSQRIVHIDLKGAPPKIDYLLKVIPLFAQLGKPVKQ